MGIGLVFRVALCQQNYFICFFVVAVVVVFFLFKYFYFHNEGRNPAGFRLFPWLGILPDEEPVG